MGNTWNYYLHPEVTPYDATPLEFDPLYGFPEGSRKKKVYQLPMDEIESVQLEEKYRGFCTPQILEYLSCRAHKFPFIRQCQPLLHHYQSCEFQEALDTMKDYERERRLMVRRQRILQKRKNLEAQTIAA